MHLLLLVILLILMLMLHVELRRCWWIRRRMRLSVSDGCIRLCGHRGTKWWHLAKRLLHHRRLRLHRHMCRRVHERLQLQLRCEQWTDGRRSRFAETQQVELVLTVHCLHMCGGSRGLLRRLERALLLPGHRVKQATELVGATATAYTTAGRKRGRTERDGRTWPRDVQFRVGWPLHVAHCMSAFRLVRIPVRLRA